jgi:magnesium transporter
VREVIRGKHTVGAMMDFELITVRPDDPGHGAARLRLRGQIPENTDKLFVTDRRNRLQGELPSPPCRCTSPKPW